jgi:hypothetical protein
MQIPHQQKLLSAARAVKYLFWARTVFLNPHQHREFSYHLGWEKFFSFTTMNCSQRLYHSLSQQKVYLFLWSAQSLLG